MTKKIELTREELTTILHVATGNVKDFVMDSEKFIDEQLEAINYTRCCTEFCPCGGSRRVALDCTMKPCKHPDYFKG
jgi:hypothetical protein